MLVSNPSIVRPVERKFARWLNMQCRLSSSSDWNAITRDMYNSAFAGDDDFMPVTNKFPDYDKCCRMVRRIVGDGTVLVAGTLESLGRCISTLTSHEREGVTRLCVTTAVVCMPTPSKDLEKVIQAISRGATCNAKVMRGMNIQYIDFVGIKQVSCSLFR